MILRLAREQFRARKRASLWTGALLAFSLALSTYVLVMAATVLQFRADGSGYNPWGNPLENFASDEASFGFPWVVVPETDEGPERITMPYLGEIPDPPTLSELETKLATTAGATHASFVTIAEPAGGARPLAIFSIRGFDWEAALAEGHAPGADEIVLRADVARQFGLGLGDALRLSVTRDGVVYSTVRTVVGYTLPADVAPFWLDLPGAYADWEDLPTLSRDLPWAFADADGERVVVIQPHIVWAGDAPELEPYLDEEVFGISRDHFDFSNVLWAYGPSGWALLVAGLTLFALVTAALGLGRTQAEARTKWAATARSLGATRASVAGASLVETATFGVVAVTAGIGGGIAVAATHVSVLGVTHPASLLPRGVSVPGQVVVLAVAVGGLLTVILAVIPAFWASRVAPVAALKPVTPVGQAQLSREVSPWWPTAVAGIAAALWCGIYAIGERRGWVDGSALQYLSWVASLAGFVAGVTMLVQAARFTVLRVGVALARSPRPWVLAAGDALVARRRLYTSAALGPALVAGVFGFWSAADIGSHQWYDPHYRGWGEWPLPGFREWWGAELIRSGAFGVAAVSMTVLVAIAVTVTLVAGPSRSADDATRAALGLSDAHSRSGAALGQWLVMGAGTTWGGVLGCALPILFHVVGAALSPRTLVYSLHWNLSVAAYALSATGVAVLIGWAISLAGALVVGLAARRGTPVEALRAASR